MAIVPEAQLMPLVLLGPVTPNSMATLQLAAPAKTISASDASTARIPPSTYRACWVSAIPTPPSAVPIITPTRSGFSRLTSSSASARARRLEATLN